MAVHYRELHFHSPDHEKVSNQWYVLLYNINKYSKGSWIVTEGHRTMARQAELVAEKGVWSPSNPHGAAVPSPRAPHIRTGRPDHAIDVAPGADFLIAAAKRRGVTLTRTVPGEPWHLEANAAQLKRYYDKNHKKVFAKPKPKPKPKPKKKSATKVSSRGVKMIASFEGGMSRDGKFHPYKDAVGVWTIGYGHTAGVRSSSSPLTKAEAEALLKHDLNVKYAPPVAKAAKAAGVTLTQNEFDALVSAVYNLGPGILDRGRSMGDALRAKSRKKMAAAFPLYVKAGGKTLPGLVKRRAAERKLFLTK